MLKKISLYETYEWYFEVIKLEEGESFGAAEIADINV